MTRRLYQFILYGLILTSCSNDVETNKSGQTTENAETFLKQFPKITTDDLHIYSPCDKTNGNKFSGHLIDSSFYHYFEFDDVLISNLRNKVGNIFSCFQINLPLHKTGLLVRNPSQYSETAVDLFVWDNNNKKIVGRIALADAFGDGEWYFVRDAWLRDLNGDKNPDIITRKMEWWMDEEEDGSREHTADSLRVFMTDQTTFVLTKFPVDTNQYIVLDWDKR
jgi:hypothetical protein